MEQNTEYVASMAGVRIIFIQVGTNVHQTKNVYVDLNVSYHWMMFYICFICFFLHKQKCAPYQKNKCGWGLCDSGEDKDQPEYSGEKYTNIGI